LRLRDHDTVVQVIELVHVAEPGDVAADRAAGLVVVGASERAGAAF
jgi:hypothetical protein